jgi:hypothetical protein
MNVSTQILLEKLRHASDIMEYLNHNSNEFLSETVGGYLTGLLEQRSLKVADITDASGLGDYVYKVFRDERHASRDVLIAIAVGMRLSHAETQLLLRIGRCAALDPRNHEDSVALFSLEKQLTKHEMDELLHDLGEHRS